jgi:hypothetical protein
MSGPTLFDTTPDAPTQLSAGLEASERSAGSWSPAEVLLVDKAIRACAYFLPEFTADDVWKRLPDGFPVTKGLAARLSSASRAGVIEATDRVRKSARGGAHDHGQRLTIWRSL